jgi:hypothetical protein
MTGMSFATVYASIMMGKCATCHSMGAMGPAHAGFNTGKLDLSTETAAYTNLVGAMAMGNACKGKGTLVVKNDSATSILYSKLMAKPTCGVTMPHAPAKPLVAADIATIKAWIDSGAAM